MLNTAILRTQKAVRFIPSVDMVSLSKNWEGFLQGLRYAVFNRRVAGRALPYAELKTLKPEMYTPTHADAVSGYTFRVEGASPLFREGKGVIAPAALLGIAITVRFARMQLAILGGRLMQSTHSI
jgi:hypothetical protein